jgi:NADPH2:quinone reductase
MKALQIQQTGGPDQLKLVELAVPKPGAGEVLVKIHYSGVNYIDVYQREGRYKVALPFVLGQEAAGVVEDTGEGVRDLAKGDGVAWCGVLGTYAEYAVVPAERVVAVPKGLDLKLAASAMLQGMTAHYLAHSTFPLQRGEIALVHAAAGGVGLLLTQIAVQAGARVIGTVSTEEKAALAREAGATDIILYTKSDFETETRRLTGDRGVDVVYDSVGKTTFDKSLNCLRPRGMMVLFGGSSGAVPPMDPTILSAKGSLFLTRPSLNHYTITREELTARAGEVLAWVQTGKLKLRTEHIYPLTEAAQAHRDLESRRTTGKILLEMP